MYLFELQFCPDICPGVGLLDHMAHMAALSFFLFFGGVALWHIEVVRLGIESELQLLAYATATDTQYLSCICNLYHSPSQRQILNPLSKDRIEPTFSCILVTMETYKSVSCFG